MIGFIECLYVQRYYLDMLATFKCNNMLLRSRAPLILFILVFSSTLLCILLEPPFTKVSINPRNLPIQSAFHFPYALPPWPPGEGFANGYIDLGGLEVHQVTSFKKIWGAYEGGHGNLGATFYEPSEIPDGFFMLGSYSQPNKSPFYGWVLVAKDATISNKTGDQGALKEPIDYTLVWSSKSSHMKQHGHGYIWFPIAPDGYEPVGHVVTRTPQKPRLDKIRCVRVDFTSSCELENWIWGDELGRGNGFGAYSLRPSDRGAQASGLSVGTFAFQTSKDSSIIPLSCLKNKNNIFSSMPNLAQINDLVQAYSPRVYLNPNEIYLPSSVNWFFANGARLYTQGQESKPLPINYNGSNLPQGGSDDKRFWLDLPIEQNAKENLKKGYLPSFESYLHIKPMFGGTYTDIAIWLFYPFNGPGTLKIGPFDIPLGKIGEHVGDWEHITLRISNFDALLHKVYFSQHSGGTWTEAPLLQFENGSNKFMAYASLNGHACYSKPGVMLQGSKHLGLRNDMDQSDMVMDTGSRYVIIGADHLGSLIIKPPWVNYAREWGPKRTYSLGVLMKVVDNVLFGKYRSAFENFLSLFPEEILGEEGPVGPKMKVNWKGDEI